MLDEFAARERCEGLGSATEELLRSCGSLLNGGKRQDLKTDVTESRLGSSSEHPGSYSKAAEET